MKIWKSKGKVRYNRKNNNKMERELRVYTTTLSESGWITLDAKFLNYKTRESGEVIFKYHPQI